MAKRTYCSIPVTVINHYYIVCAIARGHLETSQVCNGIWLGFLGASSLARTRCDTHFLLCLPVLVSGAWVMSGNVTNL